MRMPKLLSHVRVCWKNCQAYFSKNCRLYVGRIVTCMSQEISYVCRKNFTCMSEKTVTCMSRVSWKNCHMFCRSLHFLSQEPGHPGPTTGPAAQPHQPGTSFKQTVQCVCVCNLPSTPLLAQTQTNFLIYSEAVMQTYIFGNIS